MKFENAYSGVKKIHAAIILSMISTLVVGIASFFGFLAIGAAGDALVNTGEDAVKGAVIGAGLAGIFLIIGAVIALIAYILKIVGVGKAMKDEAAFKTAFIIIFVGLAATVLATAFSGNAKVSQIASEVQSLCDFAVLYYIITGIGNLADKLNNAAVKAKGQTVLKLIGCFYAIAIIAGIVAIFAETVASIIAAVSSVLIVIALIVYIVYLAQAKKMLA